MNKDKKVVYCYLCADILHIGHLKHLRRARELGDFVIAGILTDKAIMEKKPKPIIPFEERMETMEAIRYVDKVVPQYSYSPLDNVKKFKPDVLLESDSHLEQPANEYIESCGGEVVVAAYYNLQSSSDIKKLIQNHGSKFDSKDEG